MIPKGECRDRQLYRLRARNIRFGVFRAETGGFFGIRRKFGSEFVDEEFHHDNGAPYGTVNPLEELPDRLPDDVLLTDDLGSACKCGVACEYVAWPEGGEREIVLTTGGTMKVSGVWTHLATTDCVDVRPQRVGNKPLFDWLIAAGIRHA